MRVVGFAALALMGGACLPRTRPAPEPATDETGAKVVGAFTGGVIAHAVGVSSAIFATALLMAGYGVWAFFQRPELRRLSSRTM